MAAILFVLHALLTLIVVAFLLRVLMPLAVAILVASNFFPDSLDHIIDSAFHQSNRQVHLLNPPSQAMA